MKKVLIPLLTVPLMLGGCKNSGDSSSSQQESTSQATSVISQTTSATSKGTSTVSEATSQATSATSKVTSAVSTTSQGTSSTSHIPTSTSQIPVKTFYTITFKDYQGNILESKDWEENSVPSYDYQISDTVEWKFTFKGWSETLNGTIITLPKVTKNATYYAVVEKTKQTYTLTFNSNGGSSVSSITQEYNTSIEEPTKPTKEGYYFVSWCSDSTLKTAVTWPLTLTGNQTVYAKWNEKVDIKGYLSALLTATKQDPYSFIPETMRPSNEDNFVSASDVAYDFNNFTDVSAIKYGGFGEQWQMVIENISQSENFYTVLTLADDVISTSVVAFNNWFDKNPGDTNKSIEDTGYYAKVDFASGILTYTIQLKTGFTIPLFGEVLPQIDMKYDIISGEKSVRINLTDTNALRYVASDNKYVFGIEYGVDGVNRSAYCELNKNNDESINGHIYEYITLKDKDAVKSCADFYADDTYVSVVGNKASGIIGMSGYINELYNVTNGKLLGYKVQETKDFPVIGTSTYHTLWFNLNNISGINSVKAVPNGNVDVAAKNTHDVYVNGSTKIFEPTYNIFVVKTSRKYDIELRKQYLYGEVDSKLTCYETSIPMMFIQDDHDGYTNYSEFESDIKKDNGITASVNLASKYLTKIRNDYDELIPLFQKNKELVNSELIKSWIGSAIK